MIRFLKSRNVILLAVALLGMVLTFSGCISPNQPPIAAFTFSPAAPVANSVVNFDASTSTDPDGAIVQYAWTFGDGVTGSNVTSTHTYTAAGTYTVILTVTDNNRAIAMISQDITVSDSDSDDDSDGDDSDDGDSGSDNQPPTAAFTGAGYSNSSGIIPRPAAGTWVDFDASASSDPDGTIVQYAWNFGDGMTGSGTITAHIFQNDTGGVISYTITLTVTDDGGASAFASMEIKFTPPLPENP